MRRALLIAAALAAAGPARAELRARFTPADPHAPVPLELQLFDAPYNQRGGWGSPSMQQSLALAGSAYGFMHGGIGQLLNPWRGPAWKRWLGVGVIATADLLTGLLPPFYGWQHEEWHRAVLSQRGMQSRNDIYDFNLLAEVVAVSHVRDQDLAELKARWPAEQVRLSTAGIEGNYELGHHLERQVFFDDSPAFHLVTIGLLYLSNTAYLATCASSADGDALTDRQNAAEGSDVERRDFTGLDCTAWVYDLFRPDEPYAARGAHPSGVGIDRYRRPSDLDGDERAYLDRQVLLSLLNFVDLQLVAVRGLEIDRGGAPPIQVGFAIRHLPTSFGYVVRNDVYLRAGRLAAIVQQQNYFNRTGYFPGLDLTLWRYPLASRLPVSLRLGGWRQPEGQRFHAARGVFGGLASARIGFVLHPRLEPFVELEGKSAGWVAGNVALERAFAVRAGLVTAAF